MVVPSPHTMSPLPFGIGLGTAAHNGALPDSATTPNLSVVTPDRQGATQTRSKTMKRPMIVLWRNLALSELARFGDRVDSMPREALEDFAREAINRLVATNGVLRMYDEMVESMEAEANERARLDS